MHARKSYIYKPTNMNNLLDLINSVRVESTHLRGELSQYKLFSFIKFKLDILFKEKRYRIILTNLYRFDSRSPFLCPLINLKQVDEELMAPHKTASKVQLIHLQFLPTNYNFTIKKIGILVQSSLFPV